MSLLLIGLAGVTGDTSVATVIGVSQSLYNNTAFHTHTPLQHAPRNS
jgi:hypothetical protein